MRDERELELEIERKCVALGLDFNDRYQVQQFAHDLLQNVDGLRKAAGEGDRVAQVKVELYGLSLLMHRTNAELMGPGYLTQFDSLSKQQTVWAVIAQAIWRELEVRNPEH